MTDFVPVNTPLLDGKEREYLLECIDTGWISSEGPFVRRFESEFAARHGRGHGVAVTNGSAALDAAVAALGLEQGDEVIMPAFTIVSCANAIVRSGATPVLVDCDPVTWNMDVHAVKQRITPRTRAVMAVHIYGLPVHMQPLCELAREHGLMIIEDAAEVIGQTCEDRPCGSFGDISVFSFYPNKHVTTGEGGMILTDEAGLADRCRGLRNLCFQAKQRFVHEEMGWNLRMTNLQAALGVAQLEMLETHLDRKRAIGAFYTRALSGLDHLQLPLESTLYADNVYWVFGLVLGDQVPFEAREAMARLGKLGIGTRPFFWPMHEQPLFHNMGLFEGERHPVSERLARRGFYIPSGLALTDSQLERVADAVREVLA